jgi:hypothetical protein
VLVLGMLAVGLSARTAAAQVSVRLSLGGRYSTSLVQDSIVVPIDLRPAIAPALQLSVRDQLRGPWTADATLDLSPGRLKREESGTTVDAGSFTAIALTIGLRREFRGGWAVRAAVGGLTYSGDESVFQRGAGGLLPLLGVGASYALPVGTGQRFEVGLNYDLHRFITPALRNAGFSTSRPVHRIAVTASARLIGQ